MTTQTNYQQQAIDFLQATNCEFSATYLKTCKYFPSDKDELAMLLLSSYLVYFGCGLLKNLS